MTVIQHAEQAATVAVPVAQGAGESGFGATREQVLESAARSRVAAAGLALLNRAVKDRALLAMADALLDRRAEILAVNELDVQAAAESGVAGSLLDRLRLNSSRVDGMAAGLR